MASISVVLPARKIVIRRRENIDESARTFFKLHESPPQQYVDRKNGTYHDRHELQQPDYVDHSECFHSIDGYIQHESYPWPPSHDHTMQKWRNKKEGKWSLRFNAKTDIMTNPQLLLHPQVVQFHCFPSTPIAPNDHKTSPPVPFTTEQSVSNT